MIHISQITNKTKHLEYWRNPTKEEIKFGHGATHYRDFEFTDCFDENGFLKQHIRSTEDSLVYYSSDIEFPQRNRSRS